MPHYLHCHAKLYAAKAYRLFGDLQTPGPEMTTGNRGLHLAGPRHATGAEAGAALRPGTLLADTKFHDPAKAEALLRGFDERLAEMFFDKMSPDEIDFGAIRDEEIPASRRW